MKVFRFCVFLMHGFIYFFFLSSTSIYSQTFHDNENEPFEESSLKHSDQFSCIHSSIVHFDKEERFILNNNSDSLRCLIETSDREIEIIPEENELKEFEPKFPRKHFWPFLRLVATIHAPLVGNEPLGATDVILNGRYAVITYNTQGESYLGAIQIVDLIRPRNPVLLFQLILKQAEFNSALFEGNSLFLVGDESQDVTHFPTPAEIQKINFDSNFLPIDFLPPIALPSYTATDIISFYDSLFITTANTGGLVRLNKSNLTQNGFLPLRDARSVALDETNNKIYVFQGTPGRMTVVDPRNFSHQTYFVGGASIPESKGSIEISDNLVFIGAGDGGTLIVSKTGRLLGTIPNPQNRHLPPEKQTTNAVTTDHHFIMMANGEAGVRIGFWWTEIGKVKAIILGKLNFGDYFGAVNGVNYKGKYLLVAAGLGGLKVVEVEIPHF